jgi:hypothetical protein
MKVKIATENEIKKLSEKIAKYRIPVRTIASNLGMCASAIYMRLRGDTPFPKDEVMLINAFIKRTVKNAAKRIDAQ